MAPKNKKINWWLWWLLPVPLFWGWLAQEGRLQPAENFLLDWRFRFRGEMAAPLKVFYVDVDTRAVQRIGERPWNRGRFAEAAQYLFEQGGAKAIGLDFVFSAYGHSELVNQADAAKGNLALARVARKYPALILAAQYTRGAAATQHNQLRDFPLLRLGYTDRAKNAEPELPQYPIIGATLTSAWGTIGLIDTDAEYSGDKTPRWAPLFTESPTTNFWHAAVQLACVELGVPPGSARRNGEVLEIFSQGGEVLRRIPLTAQQLLEINWFSPWDNQTLNPRTSMADVLIAGEMLKSSKPLERAEAVDYFKRFAGAIIFVGPVDPLLQDLAPTPFDAVPVPKVGLHGNLLKTIIAEQYLQRPPPWALWVSIFVLTFAVTGLVTAGGARSHFTKVLALLVPASYLVVAFHQFAQSHLILPLAAPVGAAFSTGFIAMLCQLVVEERQKGRIKSMFGSYLAPELVNRMVESDLDPQLGGHEEVITAYFSDIQSFSTFAEIMSPAQLVELMNEYLTVCTDIIQEEGGTLDKYIGDAVVAIFGAPLPLPDHAYRACLASQRVQWAMQSLSEKWRGEGEKWPALVQGMRSRLGLNTGPAVIGNMGSRTRFSYTMMGDNVNLAARMESGAKALGVYTMVTDATKLACEKYGGERIVFRFLDKIIVKGRGQPVAVFEIVGLRENVPPATLQCLALYAQALALYFRQDWDGAVQIFEQSLALEPNQVSPERGIENNPSSIFIERCRRLKFMRQHSTDPQWDGVFELKDK